jgi:hypothetical protein
MGVSAGKPDGYSGHNRLRSGRSTPAAFPRGRWYDARLFVTGRICAGCFGWLCFAVLVDFINGAMRHRGATHAGAAVSTQGT